MLAVFDDDFCRLHCNILMLCGVFLVDVVIMQESIWAF